MSRTIELATLPGPSERHGPPPWPHNGSAPVTPDLDVQALDGGEGPNSEPVQRWNESWTVTSRVLVTFWAFFLMGANDAAYGALLPALGKTYGLTLVVVSLIFLAPFVGYIASAASIDKLHRTIGQRGIGLLGAGAHIVAYAIAAAEVPFVVLVLAFALAGFGNGIADAAWNAWIGSLANASELLGIMHACYGIGGVLSPALVVVLGEKGLEWFWFYRIMVGLAAVEAIVSTLAFWRATGAAFCLAHGHPQGKQYFLMEALFSGSARVTLISSLFLLGYVGVEVALGGFIVVFMIQARHGDPSASGLTATGFWLGLAVGRIVLGFIGPRVGLKFAVMVYLLAAIGLELLFWLVPQFIVSATAIALQGVFLGPLFPAVILVIKRSLPKHLHVSVIGLASAFGAFGAALIPLSIGVLAQLVGVTVLQPVVLAVLGSMLVLWSLLPKIDMKREASATTMLVNAKDEL